MDASSHESEAKSEAKPIHLGCGCQVGCHALCAAVGLGSTCVLMEAHLYEQRMPSKRQRPGKDYDGTQPDRRPGEDES